MVSYHCLQRVHLGVVADDVYPAVQRKLQSTIGHYRHPPRRDSAEFFRGFVKIHLDARTCRRISFASSSVSKWSLQYRFE